ncbi:MAG: hypothetical protein WC794_01650 [Candidatus Doudnabacteria bacterium]|jgi:hypothetical protein
MSRLMNVCVRFQRVFAIMALVLVFNFTAAAATDDFVSFVVNCNGVLGDVVAKGYSPLVVGYAVDKDGNELAPSEFETYAGSTLRVPKSALDGKKPANLTEAREKWAAIAAAHEDRIKAIGKKQYEAAAKQCETELNPPTAPAPKFKSFKISPTKLSIKLGETGKFTAEAILSEGSEDVTRYTFDKKGLSVVRLASGIFEVKALTPGDHKITLRFGDEETNTLVHVEDFSLLEKAANFLNEYSGWLLGFIILMLILLAGLLVWRRHFGSQEPDVIQVEEPYVPPTEAEVDEALAEFQANRPPVSAPNQPARS